MTRPLRSRIPAHARKRTLAEWESILEAEGMPAELAPIHPEYKGVYSVDGRAGLGGIVSSSSHLHGVYGVSGHRHWGNSENRSAAQVLSDREATSEFFSMVSDILWGGTLAPDEFDVLELFNEGMSERRIAERLGKRRHYVNKILDDVCARHGLDRCPFRGAKSFSKKRRAINHTGRKAGEP